MTRDLIDVVLVAVILAARFVHWYRHRIERLSEWANDG